MRNNVPPSKAEELEILEAAIEQLGPDSYLGPWLTQVRAEVESAIRSDYFPEISLNEAQKRGQAIVEDAKLKAEAIRQTAEREQGRKIRELDKLRSNFIDSLRDVIRTIERP